MIYISLADYSFEELLPILAEHPYAEIRLDRLALQPSQIRQVFQQSPYLIATCRPGKLADAARLQQLQTAVAAGAAMLDIELDAPEDYRQRLFAAARAVGCKIILSYHNYDRTPRLEELRRILQRCTALRPDYVKLVTFCQRASDGERLLKLYQHTTFPLIAFGMGAAGRQSRLKALQYGAPLIFAAWDEQHQTAAGQLTKIQIEKLLGRNKRHD